MISPGAPDDRSAEGSRILVDSSVWIDFYRPGCPEALRGAVLGALSRDRVWTLPLIAAEVVQGAPDEEHLDALAGDFAALHPLGCGVDVGTSAARIGYALRRAGRRVPATDLLIAAAAVAGECELWHRDHHFETIATVTPLKQRTF
jgi:predicted nucleic acid-binding protein